DHVAIGGQAQAPGRLLPGRGIEVHQEEGGNQPGKHPQEDLQQPHGDCQNGGALEERAEDSAAPQPVPPRIQAFSSSRFSTSARRRSRRTTPRSFPPSTTGTWPTFPSIIDWSTWWTGVRASTVTIDSTGTITA